MIFLLALLPATGLTVAGYFVLFLSHRSEGGLRTFGRYLGFWAFTLAGLVILGAVFAAAHHRHGPPPPWAWHERMHGPWMHEREWGPPPGGEPHAGPIAPAEGQKTPPAPPPPPPSH